jgi:hypothetical protein
MFVPTRAMLHTSAVSPTGSHRRLVGTAFVPVQTLPSPRHGSYTERGCHAPAPDRLHSARPTNQVACQDGPQPRFVTGPGYSEQRRKSSRSKPPQHASTALPSRMPPRWLPKRPARRQSKSYSGTGGSLRSCESTSRRGSSFATRGVVLTSSSVDSHRVRVKVRKTHAGCRSTCSPFGCSFGVVSIGVT